MESNIKDLYQKTAEMAEINDQRSKDEYHTRHTSVGRILSCDVNKKEYEIELLDEQLIVRAIHADSNSGILLKDSFNPGDKILVSHKKGGDAQIIGRYDRGTLQDDGDSVDKGFFSWMKGILGGS